MKYYEGKELPKDWYNR